MDHDADAFVCPLCWHKVDEFHQFYQNVLMLYQTHQWQASQKTLDNDINVIEHKMELSVNDGTENVDSPDSVDADDGHHFCQNDDDNSCEDDIKTEMCESKELRTPKRKRGRPRKADVIISTIKTESNLDMSLKNENADAGEEISRYFSMQCNICGDNFINFPAAKLHYQQTHKKRGFLQCQCGKRFSSETSIRKHCAFHADPCSYKCIECSKIYKNSERLENHFQSKHKNQKDPHGKIQHCHNDELLRQYMCMSCDMCNVTFDTFEEALQHHVDAHRVTGYLMCCGKKFHKKCRAVQHCRWHAYPHQFE